MSTLTEIKEAIKQLPQSEIRKLSTWIQEYLDEQWDRQIEADFESGKLDRLIAKAQADIAANNLNDLDETLCDDSLMMRLFLDFATIEALENNTLQPYTTEMPSAAHKLIEGVELEE